MHEHRGPGGDGRVTTFNLIFGMHDLRGELKDKDSGRVKLKSASETGTEFAGTISVDYEANTLSVAGSLKLDGQPNDIDATLTCKECRRNCSGCSGAVRPLAARAHARAGNVRRRTFVFLAW